jgi:hypothetical protein
MLALMILSRVPVNAGVLLLTQHTHSKISQYLSNRDTSQSSSNVLVSPSSVGNV